MCNLRTFGYIEYTKSGFLCLDPDLVTLIKSSAAIYIPFFYIVHNLSWMHIRYNGRRNSYKVKVSVEMHTWLSLHCSTSQKCVERVFLHIYILNCCFHSFYIFILWYIHINAHLGISSSYVHCAEYVVITAQIVLLWAILNFLFFFS